MLIIYAPFQSSYLCTKIFHAMDSEGWRISTLAVDKVLFWSGPLQLNFFLFVFLLSKPQIQVFWLQIGPQTNMPQNAYVGSKVDLIRKTIQSRYTKICKADHTAWKLTLQNTAPIEPKT